MQYTPKYIVDALKRFGTDMLSGRPLWRIVWSADQVRLLYGELVPRYNPEKPRWILERYCPPAFYGTREAWERTKDFETGQLPLGPYPECGGYEHSFTFQHLGEFVPLAEDFVVLICTAIERGRMGTNSDTLHALQQAQEKAHKAEIDRLESFVGEFAVPHGAAAVSGTPGGGDAAKIAFNPASAIPQLLKRAGTGFAQLGSGPEVERELKEN